MNGLVAKLLLACAGSTATTKPTAATAPATRMRRIFTAWSFQTAELAVAADAARPPGSLCTVAAVRSERTRENPCVHASRCHEEAARRYPIPVVGCFAGQPPIGCCLLLSSTTGESS